MKPKKQNPDFLYLGKKLLNWYRINARNLPWRSTRNPYKIWISEIILQQTQVKQGLQHYLNFVQRFPNVETLANADTDEVLLYWKGLGYYSRALNLHKAAQQIITDFEGEFPQKYEEILKLKGVGKYTAAAIASICYHERKPAIDGNFYRVLSRLFADDYDISQAGAFQYFSELALQMMPYEACGDFNQAIMDLGAEVCKPKQPLCQLCPLEADCMAWHTGAMAQFPVKTKKVKATDLALRYYFVHFENRFLIRQRADDFIWKKLYEFPDAIPEDWLQFSRSSTMLKHKLTHKNLEITINTIALPSEVLLETLAEQESYIIVDTEASHQKSFPKPLEAFIQQWEQCSNEG